MNRVSIAAGLALCMSLNSLAQAQRVPPPPPAPAESDLVKDAQQLFSDLNAHQEKIERAEVDDEAKRLQEDILKTWDRLLDSAQQPPSDQQPSDQNQSGQPDQNSQSKPDSQQQDSASQPMDGQQQNGRSGEQEGEPETGTGEPGQSTGQPTNEPADQADAEARLRQQSRLARLRQEERERLMKEVWGKLPQRIRQKLLNASDEKYLPEYEDRIQEYFRKLSEPEHRSRTD
jgi:hypothetical protein